MQTRRTLLALGASAAIASTAGCIENLPFAGDGPMTFTAQPATVPESALDETGYEQQEIKEVVVEETFEAGGQSQDVVVTNWQAEYDRAVDFGDLGIPVDGRQQAAVFTALATPQVSVLGQTFNPVADMSSEELAEMVQDRYEGLENLDHVGEESLEVAGESTTVGELEGEASLIDGGLSVELTLHIAEAVEAGEDLIVAVGGYPTELRDEEHPNIVTMMEAIEHEE